MLFLDDKYKLLLILGFALSSNLFGQNYTLSGTVRELERNTGAPLQEVRIDVDSSKFIAFTNADGTYSISGIPAGTHNIRVSKPGFVGFFKKDYMLDGNKSFDACMSDTIQESPQGTQVLKVDEFRELPPFNQYTGLNLVREEFPNSSMWNHVTEGNLIPVLLLNATHLDSLAFRNAIGACNGNWQDSPDGSVEKGQKRSLYILSNDPLISVTKRGIKVDFDASSTNTIILAYEQNINYISRAQVNLRSNSERIIKKEIMGRSFNKQDVFNRPSYMNSDPADMTDLDHMLNIVFFNQWAAIYRNEQDANIFDMEKTPTFNTPSATNIITPTNNASGLEKNVRIQYNNIFGTDKYRLQISDKEDFSTILKDLNVMRTDTVIALDPHTTYYARVQTQNSKGISPWSTKVKFTTKNLLPAIPITDSPTNGQTLSAANYQNGLLILKYTSTAKDADNDNVTTTFIVTGPNVNKTFNSTQGGQVTQTLDSLLLQPGQTYTTAISATDGIGTVNGTGTTFIVPVKQNTAPTAFMFIRPLNNSTVTYNNKKIEIETSIPTDADGDELTKKIRLYSAGVIDTLMSMPGTVQILYLDSAKVKLDTEFTLTGEVTDGKATTPASNSIKFRTPKLTGIDDISLKSIKAYPVPVKDGFINIEYDPPYKGIRRIISLDGKVLDSKEIDGMINEQIDMTRYSRGMYIIEINNQAIRILKN